MPLPLHQPSKNSCRLSRGQDAYQTPTRRQPDANQTPTRCQTKPTAPERDHQLRYKYLLLFSAASYIPTAPPPQNPALAPPSVPSSPLLQLDKSPCSYPRRNGHGQIVALAFAVIVVSARSELVSGQFAVAVSKSKSVVGVVSGRENIGKVGWRKVRVAVLRKGRKSGRKSGRRSWSP